MEKITENINKNTLKTLILENCLLWGQKPKFTNKRIIQYLLGTRNILEVFSIKEIAHSLLRIHPFIQSFFQTFRLAHLIRTKSLLLKNHRKSRSFRQLYNKQEKKLFKPINNKINASWEINNNRPNKNLQILFITRTPSYTSIVKSAAQSCKMPFNNKNWFYGSISTNTNVIKNIGTWHTMLGTEDIKDSFQTALTLSESTISTKNTIITKKSVLLKQPTLIIIPDLDRNKYIGKEATNAGIPVIGLLDTDSTVYVDYPIFGNSRSIHVVHFFCHFLAKLIIKEIKNIFEKNILFTSHIRQKKNKTHHLVGKTIKQRLRIKNKQINYRRCKNDEHIKVRRKQYLKQQGIRKVYLQLTDRREKFIFRQIRWKKKTYNKLQKKIKHYLKLYGHGKLCVKLRKRIKKYLGSGNMTKKKYSNVRRKKRRYIRLGLKFQRFKRKPKPFFAWYREYNIKLSDDRKEQYHLMNETGRTIKKILNVIRYRNFTQVIHFLKKYPHLFIPIFNVYLNINDSHTIHTAVVFNKERSVQKNLNLRINPSIQTLISKEYNIHLAVNSFFEKQRLWKKWFGRQTYRIYFASTNNHYYWKGTKALVQKKYITTLIEQLKYHERRIRPLKRRRFFSWQRYKYRYKKFRPSWKKPFKNYKYTATSLSNKKNTIFDRNQ